MSFRSVLIVLFLCAISSSIGVYITDRDNTTFTIKNSNTRDYNYEHYCDSIYEVDKDYYNDALVETDKFQSYIDEHGEWWTN